MEKVKNDGRFKPKFTKEKELEICDKYINEFKNLTFLGKEYDCSSGTIKNILVRNGFQTRTRSETKRIKDNTQIHLDPLIFEQDNEDSSYWLGMMYSDGCVVEKNGEPNRIELGLKETDKEHIENFAKWIKWEGTIQTRSNSKGFSNNSVISRVQINNAELAYSLIRLGCTPKKSLTLECIPNLKKENIIHFIRGYFDGDGSVEKDRGRITFTGTENFLKEIAGYFQLPYRLYKKTDNNTYQLFYNTQESKIILKQMYLNANYKLTRKYEIAQKFISLST